MFHCLVQKKKFLCPSYQEGDEAEVFGWCRNATVCLQWTGHYVCRESIRFFSGRKRGSARQRCGARRIFQLEEATTLSLSSFFNYFPFFGCLLLAACSPTALWGIKQTESYPIVEINNKGRGSLVNQEEQGEYLKHLEYCLCCKTKCRLTIYIYLIENTHI